MEIEQLKKQISSSGNNELFELQLKDNLNLKIYPESINEVEGNLFFIAKDDNENFLFITSTGKDNPVYKKFEGENKNFNIDNFTIKKCPLTTRNRKLIQELFEFTRPVTIGLKNSFGFGDRIGLANPGHIRSLVGSDFKPVLAQQSIRELNRTNRTADEVMDAAVWAVLQEGYKKGFGADADHLKTEDDIDLTMNAGYKMLTFDPSYYVDNKADIYQKEELEKIISVFKWEEINSSFDEAKKNYLKEIKIDEELSINPGEINLMRAYVKYGNALIHIKNLNNYLNEKYKGFDYEIEVSVDETESVTSSFEHFFIANELTRLGVNFISLALRFVGDFEKGIDYKGDLDLFKKEYIKHLKVIKYFGSYKISLHSGSDKFSVYKVIGSLKGAFTHVKTAGTSYLEALKVVAIKEPELFKEILDFSSKIYETEKKTYHVSADVSKIKKYYDNNELLELFKQDDARQILHVAFGRVLTEKDSSGIYIFKNKIRECLKNNEDLHYKIIVEHFQKHLNPFN
ncbi:MAG: hypothetical protein EHM47_08800 [Ignavibacteriales bacterium]|nr:MAG: hypothetical protein EHM47_08800 [Ignavibacteriales bacterium]